MEPAISIEIGHPSLRHAIESQIHSAAVTANWEQAGQPIIISTTRDLTPAQCRERVDAGAVVIVLAAFPSGEAAAQYAAAGACYRAMTAGDTRWVKALSNLALKSRLPMASAD